MKRISQLVLICLTLSATLPAQKRETVELQRDVSNLADEVRTLQRTLDENLAKLALQTQQTLDAVNKNNSAVAVLDSRMGEQASKVVAPVAVLGSKLDQMSTDSQSIKEAVSDLAQRMGRLEQQILDLSNTIKVLQAPPAVPPPSITNGGPGPTSSTQQPQGPPPSGMSSRQLYDTAQRDRGSGNLDLAMQEYQQYLQYFRATELAPNAQFYIGQIFYDKGEFPSAIKAYDTVLEAYPEGAKTPDATYMKGMALWKSGQATAAGREFLDVLQKYPKSDVAAKARDARKALGLSVPSAQAAAPVRHRKR